MESHSSHQSFKNQPGRLLVTGDCSNWASLVAPLIDQGFQVEMVPDVERAGIRCVEQVVDAVVIDLTEQLDEISKAIGMLQRVSHYTKVVLMCEFTQNIPPTLAAYENLQSVAADVLPRDFMQIIRTAVRVARLTRERSDRIHTLKSLVTKIQDQSGITSNLEKLLSILQEPNPRMPFPKLKLPEIDTLNHVLARSLDPLTASRTAVDFIQRCLPGTLIASWLVGSDMRTGLAACAGNGGCNAVLAAAMLSDIETLHIPRILRSQTTCVVDDVRHFIGGNHYQQFAGRWAMLAPCKANGETFAVILIVGPQDAGQRPTQAEQGLTDVCAALAEQLSFDARIHRRANAVWPSDSTDEETDLFG